MRGKSPPAPALCCVLPSLLGAQPLKPLYLIILSNMEMAQNIIAGLDPTISLNLPLCRSGRCLPQTPELSAVFHQFIVRTLGNNITFFEYTNLVRILN